MSGVKVTLWPVTCNQDDLLHHLLSGLHYLFYYLVSLGLEDATLDILHTRSFQFSYI